jgi:hypothetical protein
MNLSFIWWSGIRCVLSFFDKDERTHGSLSFPGSHPVGLFLFLERAFRDPGILLEWLFCLDDGS